MADRRTVQLEIAGQSYRVVSSASESELRRLAAVVEEKILAMSPRNRPPPAQAVLLAAIALAHDLEEERGLRAGLERRTRDLLRRALGRIELVLDRDAG